MIYPRKWAIVVGSRVTWRRGSSGKLLHGVALGELEPGRWRVEVGPDETHDTPGAVWVLTPDADDGSIECVAPPVDA
jgi:hypothetical protein